MKIVTDSASDLPVQEIESLGVSIIPLYIHFPEGQVSSDELTADEFYTRLRAMEPNIPTTSQPSSGQFAEIYRKLAESGEEIFSIHISSGLSGTIESARLGARQVTDAMVEFFDTMTLSGGERFHVMAAAMAIKAGWSKQAILERLEKIRAATEVAYTLETLVYLARGGRIGRVQALAGSLLKIKPVICVDKKDGKYSTIGKDRTIRQAIDRITNYFTTVYGTSRSLWVTILHGQFQEQADVLTEVVKSRLKIGHLEVLRISPVLGVHTGPGIVGAAVVPMDLMEDLIA